MGGTNWVVFESETKCEHIQDLLFVSNERKTELAN